MAAVITCISRLHQGLQRHAGGSFSSSSSSSSLRAPEILAGEAGRSRAYTYAHKIQTLLPVFIVFFSLGKVLCVSPGGKGFTPVLIRNCIAILNKNYLPSGCVRLLKVLYEFYYLIIEFIREFCFSEV